MDQPEMFPEPVTGVLTHATYEQGCGWRIVVRTVTRTGQVTRDAAYERLTAHEAVDVLLEELGGRLGPLAGDDS